MANLADLCRIHIRVNHLGIGGEVLGIAGHTIVKTRADGDQQISLLQRSNSRNGAVHARHTHVQRVVRRECTQSHQGGHDRHTSELRELQQFC